MPKTCYIVFEADPTKEYAYDCGSLLPKVGQMVVVQVGFANAIRLKLVKCVAIHDDIDPIVTKKIWGIVEEQFNATGK